MKRICQYYQGRLVWVLLMLVLVAGLPSADRGWCQDISGFELKIYPATGRYEYELGEPIELIMVLSKAAGPILYTERRQIVLHEALIFTDPKPPGNVYKLNKAPIIHEMPPPFPWKGETGWKEAQALELPLSETIKDLRELHPKILRIAGWHTIKARLKLYLFDEADEHHRLGLLGLAKTGDNWQTIKTRSEDELQIFISPGFGALLQVQVLDGDSQPLAQVPVRVFNRGDIPAGYDEIGDIWLNSQPVLAGYTNFQGQAVWSSGGSCQTRDDYLVIAYHQGEYRDASIAAQDDGWGIECSGVIARDIVFVAEPPPPQAVAGDLNGDNCVDRQDFNILFAQIRSRGPYDSSFDVNNDGSINIADARYLATLFTNPGGTPCQ